ncbi:uncharacterized protein LOC129602195 isoform X2 [Paramacrobiotus metropolitanus]|uniref:uncharacterized protein LOC129602195 isoform X2 n=1 Tax=Paramacrobiotus metropolitanus TaxID=2943436 RepID=UPI0024461E5F|nr:uncharacterized protein LOC129602195 isoform X2 [Paramacrobiotus metropolitanus]
MESSISDEKPANSFGVKRILLYIIIAVLAISVIINILLAVFVSLLSKRTVAAEGPNGSTALHPNGTIRARAANVSGEPIQNSYWGRLEIFRTASLTVKYKGFVAPLYQTRQDPTLYYFAPAMIFLPGSAKSVRNNVAGKFQLEFTLLLYDDSYIAYLRTAVFKQVKVRAELRVIPIEEIRIDSVGTLSTEYEVDNNWKPYTRHPSQMTFRIFCINEDACVSAEDYATSFPRDFVSNLVVFMSLQSQVSNSRRVTVSAEHIANSKLFTELNQRLKGKTEVYLSDDDAKQMTQEVSQNIMASEVSDAEFVSQESSPTLIGLIEAALQMSSASSAGFDERKWGSVFWQDDNARPDKVTSLVNEVYEKLDQETRNLIKTAASNTTVDHVCVGKNVASAATAATTAPAALKTTTDADADDDDDDDDDDTTKTTKKGETTGTTKKGITTSKKPTSKKPAATTAKKPKPTTSKPKPTTKKKPPTTKKAPKPTPNKKPAKRHLESSDQFIDSNWYDWYSRDIHQLPFVQDRQAESPGESTITLSTLGDDHTADTNDTGDITAEKEENEDGLKIILGLIVLQEVAPTTYFSLLAAGNSSTLDNNQRGCNLSKDAFTENPQSVDPDVMNGTGNNSLGLPLINTTFDIAVATRLRSVMQEVTTAYMLGEAVVMSMKNGTDASNETVEIPGDEGNEDVTTAAPENDYTLSSEETNGKGDSKALQHWSGFESEIRGKFQLHQLSEQKASGTSSKPKSKLASYLQNTASAVSSFVNQKGKLGSASKPAKPSAIITAITNIGSAIKNRDNSTKVINGVGSLLSLSAAVSSVLVKPDNTSSNGAKFASSLLNSAASAFQAVYQTTKGTTKTPSAASQSSTVGAAKSTTERPSSATTEKGTAATSPNVSPDQTAGKPAVYSCTDGPPVTTSSSKELDEWNRLMTEKRNVVKWKGEKFEPKELSLKRVNLAHMSSTTTIHSQQVRISTASAVMKTNINFIIPEESEGEEYPNRSNAEVFFVRSNSSSTGFSYDDAENICAVLEADLATLEQVKKAFLRGAQWCFVGHVQGNRLSYPGRLCSRALQSEMPGTRTAAVCSRELGHMPGQVHEMTNLEPSAVVPVATCIGQKPPRDSVFLYDKQQILIGPFNSTRYSMYGDMAEIYTY